MDVIQDVAMSVSIMVNLATKVANPPQPMTKITKIDKYGKVFDQLEVNVIFADKINELIDAHNLTQDEGGKKCCLYCLEANSFSVSCNFPNCECHQLTPEIDVEKLLDEYGENYPYKNMTAFAGGDGVRIRMNQIVELIKSKLK